MRNQAHIDFEKNENTKVTYKQKPHGKIVYVNGATAYNSSDPYSFGSYEKVYDALKQAFQRSKV